MTATVLTVTEPRSEWVIKLPRYSLMTSFYGYRRSVHSPPRSNPLSKIYSSLIKEVSYNGYFTSSEVKFEYRFNQVILRHKVPVTGQVLVAFEFTKNLWTPLDTPEQVYAAPKNPF